MADPEVRVNAPQQLEEAQVWKKNLIDTLSIIGNAGKE
jgi:hypothetical protein